MILIGGHLFLHMRFRTQALPVSDFTVSWLQGLLPGWQLENECVEEGDASYPQPGSDITSHAFLIGGSSHMTGPQNRDAGKYSPA